MASIDPPEGSAQAEQCARFYSIARDTLLELHDWRFSIKRVLLALSADSDTWEWAYAYAVPSNYLRLLKILPALAGSRHIGLIALTQSLTAFLNSIADRAV